jgi:hypothetical protein
MAQQVSTNTFGPAKWIVSSTLSNGTHTTIAAALTSASSGDTIFIRPGTYTEDLTLKAGVDLVSYEADAFTPNVTISGTCTATFAGTCSISGINLATNSSSFLTVSGSSATIVYLKDCTFTISQTPGLSYSSSSASSRVYVLNCRGDITTLAKTFITKTSAGQVFIDDTIITNSIGSTLVSALAGGGSTITRSSFANGFSISGGTNSFQHCTLDTSAINIYCASVSNPGVVGEFYHCKLSSGTQSCLNASGGTSNIGFSTFDSTNTNPITGGGTVSYTGVGYPNTGLVMNPTTQTARVMDCGICVTPKQPSFMAYINSAKTNVTGDGTAYTVVFDTERYDIGGNYNTSTGVFTAPYTGKYLFTCTIQPEQIDAAQTDFIFSLVTSNNTYDIGRASYGILRLSASFVGLNGSCMADMDAGDTASISLAISQVGGKTVDLNASSTYNWFSGILIM